MSTRVISTSRNGVHAVSRRTVLMLAPAGVAAFALCSRAADKEGSGTSAGAARQAKLAGLLHNEDCTNFFAYQDFPAGKAGETVDRYVDVLAGARHSAVSPPRHRALDLAADERRSPQ